MAVAQPPIDALQGTLPPALTSGPPRLFRFPLPPACRLSQVKAREEALAAAERSLAERESKLQQRCAACCLPLLPAARPLPERVDCVGWGMLGCTGPSMLLLSTFSASQYRSICVPTCASPGADRRRLPAVALRGRPSSGTL